MTRRQRRTQLISLLVGLLATGAVWVGFEAGLLERLELDALDLRFRYANAIEASDQIAVVGIDDGALDQVRRWPWHRFEQAALVRVAAQAGARATLVDLTWVEPQLVAADADSGLDIRSNLADLDPSTVGMELSDYQLRAALAEADNAYLGYHYKLAALTYRDDFLGRGGVVELLADGRVDAARTLAETLEAERGGDEAVFDLARLTHALGRTPQSAPERLAAELRLAPTFVRDAYEECLRAALRRRVQRRIADDSVFARRGTADQFAAIYAELDPNGDPTSVNALTSTLELALRETLGLRATVRGGLPVGAPLRQLAPPVDRLVPTYYLLADAARGCGFTASDPDPLDGVMRHMPLMVRHGETVVPQLAVAVVCGELGLTPKRVEIGSVAPQTFVQIGRTRMQVDRRCRALIPWVSEENWQRQFGEMIPAGALWEVHDRRQKIRDNEALAWRERTALFGSGLFVDGAGYARLAERLDYLRWRERIARFQADFDHARALNEECAAAAAELETLERSQRAALAAAVSDPNAAAGFDDPAWLSEQVEQFDAFAADVARTNADLGAEADRTLGRLRQRLKDKFVLIGYTATALPDTTPTPTNPDVPGVMAHANLLNGLLTGQTVRWAPHWLNALLAFLSGVVTAMVVVWRGPREALLVVIFLAVAYVALAGWLAFYQWRYWIALVPAVSAMAAATFAIAFYRYVFADRERRQLATALGQYTSREIARQVAENAELCKRAEMREVTTIFTDLKGFTTISERIGAAATQEVLNVCLGRFTDVLLRHEAMVNKFLGDGIFAFWNPVIYPQTDHAVRGLDAAIDLQLAIEQLRQERLVVGDEIYADLQLRVGLATGKAVVGPCGSEQKFDYTCIGDSVNVASRLESANKFYGTRILVAGSTAEAGGERFVFRPLGGVQVKGKRHAVPIYELVGRRGDVPDELVIYASKFGRGVERFQQRDWLDAAMIFGARLLQRPDDLAAARYAELCARYQDHPPDEDWNGAIELTEK